MRIRIRRKPPIPWRKPLPHYPTLPMLETYAMPASAYHNSHIPFYSDLKTGVILFVLKGSVKLVWVMREWPPIMRSVTRRDRDWI